MLFPVGFLQHLFSVGQLLMTPKKKEKKQRTKLNTIPMDQVLTTPKNEKKKKKKKDAQYYTEIKSNYVKGIKYLKLILNKPTL